MPQLVFAQFSGRVPAFRTHAVCGGCCFDRLQLSLNPLLTIPLHVPLRLPLLAPDVQVPNQPVQFMVDIPHSSQVYPNETRAAPHSLYACGPYTIYQLDPLPL